MAPECPVNYVGPRDDPPCATATPLEPSTPPLLMPCSIMVTPGVQTAVRKNAGGMDPVIGQWYQGGLSCEHYRAHRLCLPEHVESLDLVDEATGEVIPEAIQALKRKKGPNGLLWTCKFQLKRAGPVYIRSRCYPAERSAAFCVRAMPPRKQREQQENRKRKRDEGNLDLDIDLDELLEGIPLQELPAARRDDDSE